MSSTSRLLQLTEQLQGKVKEVDSYIQENNLPDPSFDASYPPILDLPHNVDTARKAALEALDELRDHLLGPVGYIYETVQSHGNLVGLHGITHFNLHTTFPLESTSTIPEIAQKANIHPSDAETIIRHGLAHRFFRLLPDGHTIAHSASTRALVTVPHLHPWLVYGLKYHWRDVPYIVPAMQKWPGSQELNETAYNLSQGKTESFFQEMRKDKTQMVLFASVMKFLLDRPEMSTDFAVEGYDGWEKLAGEEGGCTVVDVGGSHGVVAYKLAKKFPEMRVVVQDLPAVVANVPAVPEGLKVEFQAHDFFKEQPFKDADVYFFRQIFHSWGDKYCVAILRALIPALKVGARVVVMERIMPEPGVLSPFQEREIRRFDIGMKQLFNSKERSEGDWRKLVLEADAGFKVLDVFKPEGSQLGFIVVEWSGSA